MNKYFISLKKTDFSDYFRIHTFDNFEEEISFSFFLRQFSDEELEQLKNFSTKHIVIKKLKGNQGTLLSYTGKVKDLIRLDYSKVFFTFEVGSLKKTQAVKIKNKKLVFNVNIDFDSLHDDLEVKLKPFHRDYYIPIEKTHEILNSFNIILCPSCNTYHYNQDFRTLKDLNHTFKVCPICVEDYEIFKIIENIEEVKK